MRKLQVFSIAAVLLSFVVSGLFYSSLPEVIPTHWNAQGVADDWSHKSFSFFIPAISVALLALLYFLPRFDPMRKNARGFEKEYDFFVLVFMLFMLYLNTITLLISTGFGINMASALALGFSGLFYSAGVLIQKAKPNWFIGIRTPWTISDERVWARTHEVGAKLFKAGAFAMLLGVAIPQLAFPLVVAFALGAGLGSVVYSYFEYKRLHKK